MPFPKNVHDSEYEFLIAGRVDGPAAHQLEVEILETIRAGASRIYLNLSEATFLCSAGIRVILQYHRQMKNEGKSLLVTRPSAAVHEILELTGFRSTLVEKI